MRVRRQIRRDERVAHFKPFRTLGENELLPVLLLLLVVSVPTVYVVWFMSRAMRSERLATRQRLSDLYNSQLYLVSEQIERRMEEIVDRLQAVAEGKEPAEAFGACIAQELSESVVCLDANGWVAYPDTARPNPSIDVNYRDAAWLEAWRLDREERDWPAAAAAYQAIANDADSADQSARALQAQIRCMVQAGQVEQAVRVVVAQFADDRFRGAQDDTGRAIAPGAELLALLLINDPHRDEFQTLLTRLVRRLTDYQLENIPGSQRRFLWQQIGERWSVDAKQIAGAMEYSRAEALAAVYLESQPFSPRDSDLRATMLPELWQIASRDRRVVALFSSDRVSALVDDVIQSSKMPEDVFMTVLRPDEEADAGVVVMKRILGMPGWRLALHAPRHQMYESQASQIIAVYLWTGILVIATMVLLAIWMGRMFRRQLRLARLKNDLVATVSHELKTPLSSMRLLLDTLLDQDRFDERRVREYLQLMSNENTRLTRLIENFLTFSRMERRRQSFQFSETRCDAIVDAALEACGDRFHADDCQLHIDVADNLPPVSADPDAMVTVLLNLLDNAHKYTEGNKVIRLRVFRSGNEVCFSVSDNGIGLTRAAQRRVFERFYQVDQSLSRRTGGCGLGLSIVEYIVTAHQGRVWVDSQPGQGSTFSVSIPCLSSGVPTLEPVPA